MIPNRDRWPSLKIHLIPSNGDRTQWVVYGLRSDGAVFWNGLSVGASGDFYLSSLNCLTAFDMKWSKASAPETCFVPFSEVRMSNA